ncbi:MAG: hypothetical protein ACRDS0_26355 [Pseudonocardiaceae bacterium]
MGVERAAAPLPAIVSPTLTPGVNNGTFNGGNGQVTISWAAPTPTPSPGTVNGGGAQSTQGVLTELSNVITIMGTKVLTSWDAATGPGQTVTTSRATPIPMGMFP